MTSKCKTKIKNPCKICLQSVTHKTGLQCQGACKKWVHFSCLNYTPGKIRDIKTGIIKVTCPCPDCKTPYLKEFRTEEPFSCTNVKCPANLPPKCSNSGCPKNQKMNQTSGSSISPPCALAQCAKDNCTNNVLPKVSNPQQCAQTNPNGPMSSSSGGFGQIPRYPYSERQASSEHVAGDRFRGGPVMPSLSVVEDMCNTVGKLTNQINDLMCKMKEVVNEKSPAGGKRTCNKTGPKAQCPKPCFCPHNPR